MRRPDGRTFAMAAVVIAPLLAYWSWRAAATVEPAPPDAASPPPVAAPAQEEVRTTGATTTVGQRSNDWLGSIALRIVATSGGAAVPDAEVTVVDGSDSVQRARTSADGEARFDGLGLGHANVRIDADGFVPSILTLVVGPWVTEKATIALDAPVTVEGTVLDAKSGAPIGYSAVELRTARVPEHEHPPIPPTTADIAGHFRFGPVPAGATVSVTAVAPGHGRATAGPTTLRPNESVAHFEIRMGRTGVVRGVVRGPDGAAVPGAWVRVAWGDDSAPSQAFSPADGSYRVDEVPLGAAVVVTAGARGFTECEPVVGAFVTEERREAAVDLTLRPPTSVVVRVFGPNGDAVRPSAAVGWRGPWLQPGPDGTITFDDVDPGTTWIRARADGCGGASRHVTLRKAERNDVEIRLDETMGIAGIVRDEAGGPVQGVAVHGGRCLDFTDSDGRFRLEPLPPGPCSVRLHRAELISAPGFDPKSPETCTIDVPSDGVVLVVASRPIVRLRVVPPAGTPCRAPEFVNECALATAPNVGDAASEAPVRFAFGDTTALLVGSVSSRGAALRIVVGGFAPVVVPLPPRSGKFVDLDDVHLSVGRSLTGRVVDGHGRPVASASVSATETTSADSTGAFTLSGLADGPAVLRATQGDAGGAAYVGAVERAAPVTIVLRPMGTLHVAVVDVAGVANGETVEVRDGAVAGTADPGRLTISTADGAGRLDVRVIPGRCRVRAGGAWSEAEVPEGGEASVRVAAK